MRKEGRKQGRTELHQLQQSVCILQQRHIDNENLALNTKDAMTKLPTVMTVTDDQVCTAVYHTC